MAVGFVLLPLWTRNSAESFVEDASRKNENTDRITDATRSQLSFCEVDALEALRSSEYNSSTNVQKKVFEKTSQRLRKFNKMNFPFSDLILRAISFL